MNTKGAVSTDKVEFENQLLNLMFADGIGPDEALDHSAAYSKSIFGKATATGVLRVRTALVRIARSAKQQ